MTLMYTERMKRLLLLVLAVLGVGLFASLPVSADTNSLTISNYDIQYDLSKDAQGRSTLKTVETITADLPVGDVNHGIERAVPSSYAGHSTSLRIQSVTDESGNSQPYSTYTSNDNTVIRIGEPGVYAHGTQTYVITYTQRDVTKYFSNIDDDELYWDTNGVEWRVPIDHLSVHLRVEDSLASALTGNVSCYTGLAGSNTSCDIAKDGNTFSVDQPGLNAGENVTIAVGFKKGTFVGYQKSVVEKIKNLSVLSMLFLLPVCAAILIWLLIKASRWSNRSKDRGAIITEFLPPKDTSIATVAGLSKGAQSVFTAELLDFAVRGYLKIIQTREKSFWRSAQYDIEVVKDISTLKAEEQELLNDIFGSVSVNSRLALKTLRNNAGLVNRMQNNDKDLKKLIRGEYGIRQRNEAQSGWFKKAGWILLVLSLVLLNPLLLAVAIISFVLGFTLWPLTDKGLELSRYLEGLKQYIKVAETERLKMLQSPEGALKIGNIDVNDGGQVVKLYEKVLPYAVLFGQEKEWNKRIGQYYESTSSSPNWYSGSNGVFNAAAFGGAMNSFSTAASYTSAGSLSSGGSSGGGSSGGGGGGGGGGGW